MDDGAPRTLIYPTPFGDASANYTIPANGAIRPEIITILSSVEPPLIVWATITYVAREGNTISRISTIPSLVDPPVVASAVAFTFGITLGPTPSFVNREYILPPAESVFDAITISQGLPDTVLMDGQTIGLDVAAWTTTGAAGTIGINSSTIWAEVIDTSAIADVVPPYTPESYLLQSQAAAA